jgi:hypothetical protein
MDPSKLQNVKPQEMVKMMQNKNTGNQDVSKKGTETKSRPKGTETKGRQTKDTETNKKKTGGSDVNEVFAVFKKWTEPSLINLYGTRGRAQIDVTRKMLDKVESNKKKDGSKRKTRRRR